MKLFSFIFLGLFCIATVAAQKISEDKFGPQLASKQKEIYDTVDKKEQALAKIEKLEKEIKDAKDDADKKSKTEAKTILEKEVNDLTTDIVSKCNDYRQYRMLLKKHQDVSQKFLDTYKVRVCNFYNDEVVAKKKNAAAGETELIKKQKAVNDKAKEIDNSEKAIATLKSEITNTENALKSKSFKNKKDSLQQVLTTKNKDLDLKLKGHQKLIFQIKSACEDFENYKKLLKEKYKVEDIILEKYKVSACALYQKEPVASAADIEKAKEVLEGKITSIDSLVALKKDTEKSLVDQGVKIKKLELEISFEKDDNRVEELTKKLEADKKVHEELKKKDKDALTQIQNSCKDFMAYKKFLQEKGKIDATVLDAFKAEKCSLYEQKTQPESERFVIVGDNAPVKFDSLFSNSSARRILADVFSIDSKTNLGTFEIPGDESFVNFYAKRRYRESIGKMLDGKEERTKPREEEAEFINSLDTNKAEIDSTSYAISIRQYKIQQGITPINSTEEPKFIGEVPEGALFKSIQIELREGGIVDTRLTLQSVDGKFEFYFEGTAPVSILHYTRKAAKRSFLKYSHYISLDGKSDIQ